MPNPGISELATSTMEARSGKVRDNVSDNNAVLLMLKEKAEEPVDGGRVIYEELEYAENSNGQWYSGNDTLQVASQDVFTSAEFAWKQYAIAIIMNGLEEIQNAGEAAVFNLLAKRILNGEHTMANAICASIYSDGTGSGGKELTGFGAMIPTDPTTGTYGGINRATAGNEWWRSQLLDAAVTPTVNTILTDMNSLWVSCTRGKDRPDVILSGSTLYKTFLGALQPNQRFTDPKLAQAGFTNVMFNTAPVVLDGGIGGNLTATDMLFLNTKYLHFRPSSKRNMVPIGKKRQAVNQDATVEFLGFAGNITSSGPQFQGRYKGD